MGSLFSRQNAIQELDCSSNNAYRYPPKAGPYFSTHFIIGGERFEKTHPETYLFGENSDLNFLGSKPTPFPYAAPQGHEPTRALKSLINIRKESVRFVSVKSPDSAASEQKDRKSVETSPSSTRYNVEFVFDTDVRCSITIKYFAKEEITANGVIYTPRDALMSSETYHYKKGVNQTFTQTSHVFDPSLYKEDMLSYKFDNEIIPVLIQCVAEEGEEPRQSHAVIAVVEKNLDGSYSLKPLKQKLFVDGLSYVLQEIYGIENKNADYAGNKDSVDDDLQDNATECVICMSAPRDTLLLPCRHLSLCQNCADSLRFQSNSCPICRAAFHAMLQIRAVKKCNNSLPQVNHNSDTQPSQDIPPGYEPVSLIEALNGPMQPSAPFVPSFGVSPQMPPFSNSPDIRQKHHHLERHHSSTTSLRCHNEGLNAAAEKDISCDKQVSLDETSVPEVVVASIIPLDKTVLKSESLSLTRIEGRRHRKGFRTSSAPEKMRLLANSVQIVNEVGSAKRKMEKDAELTETKSLLESSIAAEEISATTSSPKSSRPCSRNSPISLSTPHSLHLCEKSSKDTSPGGDDSDYYTPEDPSTTILVDQGTDTSLDTPQSAEISHISESVGKAYPLVSKHRINRERQCVIDEPAIPDEDLNIQEKSKGNFDPLKKTESNPVHIKSTNCHPLILENTNSLPGTPASNVSNHSSGDSFSSTSSTRLLLRPQSYDTLPE